MKKGDWVKFKIFKSKRKYHWECGQIISIDGAYNLINSNKFGTRECYPSEMIPITNEEAMIFLLEN